MRKLTINLYEPDVIQALVGTLYRQAPDHAPRNADVIIAAFKKEFRNKAIKFMDTHFLYINPNKLYDTIESMLLNIPEFCDLNLSQAEVDKGVKVDDPNRGGITFTDAFSTVDPYYDFIDLDAFVRNVVHEIATIMARENGELFEREPKGKYTFSCKYDCMMGLQICCEECDQKENCEVKCTSTSATCGLALHKLVEVKPE